MVSEVSHQIVEVASIMLASTVNIRGLNSRATPRGDGMNPPSPNPANAACKGARKTHDIGRFKKSET